MKEEDKEGQNFFSKVGQDEQSEEMKKEMMMMEKSRPKGQKCSNSAANEERKERRLGGCNFQFDEHEYFLWLILSQWNEVNRKIHLCLCAHSFYSKRGEKETFLRNGGLEDNRE